MYALKEANAEQLPQVDDMQNEKRIVEARPLTDVWEARPLTQKPDYDAIRKKIKAKYPKIIAYLAR